MEAQYPIAHIGKSGGDTLAELSQKVYTLKGFMQYFIGLLLYEASIGLWMYTVWLIGHVFDAVLSTLKICP